MAERKTKAIGSNKGAKAKSTETKRRSNTPSFSPKRTNKTNPSSFPQLLLEEAIEIARILKDYNALHPMKAEYLAQIMGFGSARDSLFQRMLRAANQYGIVSSSGINATVSLTDTGLDIVAPLSPDRRQNALLKAF